MAKLVYAADLKSVTYGFPGSSPGEGTISLEALKAEYEFAFLYSFNHISHIRT